MTLKYFVLQQIATDLSANGFPIDTDVSIAGAEYLEGDQLRKSVLVEVLDGVEGLPVFRKSYPAISTAEEPDA